MTPLLDLPKSRAEIERLQSGARSTRWRKPAARGSTKASSTT